jgi:hypothetical protein
VAFFKSLVPDGGLGVTFVSGIAAGALAAGLVTPMDVVKTRLQQKDSPYKNMLECYKSILASNPRLLLKGCVPRMLIVSVPSLISRYLPSACWCMNFSREFLINTQIFRNDVCFAMNTLYSAEQIKIHPELPEILKNYAKFIIKQNPEDILTASAEYFARLASQTNQANSGSQTITKLQLEVFFNKFYVPMQELRLATLKEIESHCADAGISADQMRDVLA